MLDLLREDGALIPRLREACRLVREAGRAIQRIMEEGIERERKRDHSLVTNADHAADRLLRAGLRAAFPDDRILTEESGMGHRGSRDRVWVVDPLDGTRAFARGIPGWCVMVGLLVSDVPVLGVLHDPLDDRIMYALRGQGAWEVSPAGAKPLKLHVSERATPGEQVLTTSPGLSEEGLQRVLSATDLRQGERVHSAGLKVGLVVRRHADVYFSHHDLWYWDTVAPSIIATEAGARCTLLDGSPLRYDLGLPPERWVHDLPMLVTNDHRHEAIRAAIEAL